MRPYAPLHFMLKEKWIFKEVCVEVFSFFTFRMLILTLFHHEITLESVKVVRKYVFGKILNFLRDGGGLFQF